MDLLGDLFSSIKVTKASYLCHEVSALWAHKFLCRADVNFILIVNGTCWIHTKKYPKGKQLFRGDMFVIFDKESYSISEQTSTAESAIVTGMFNISSIESSAVLSILPDYIHLTLDKITCHAMRSIFDLMATEVGSTIMGSQAIIDRVCEIFFINVIRNYSETMDKTSTVWLAAISDKNLKEVIEEIHSNISSSWTVESMAEKAGMSRSAFALKFKKIIGKPPLEYLTEWRIHKASILLQQKGTTVAHVAHSVGYESESAFNRVFKQRMGQTPGEYKKIESSM